jgi:hypothetical protein
MVDVAWIRRVMPREEEHNRSRWQTDPVWRVVQAAPFTPTPLAARRLIRRRQREHEVRRVDQALLGLLRRREALLHPDPSGRDLSVALRDLVRPLERELAARGEAFDAAVRRKRQEQGLPVSMVGRLLPVRSREAPAHVAEEQESVAELEREVGESRESRDGTGPASAGDGRASGHDGHMDADANARRRVQRRVWLRWKSAAVGLQRAYRALEEAEMRGESRRELERLVAAFEQETAREVATRERMEMVGMPLVGTLEDV